MKIGFIRYPQKLYERKQVLRGGSEIANQHIIKYLKSHDVDVLEFMPEDDRRLDLINIPAIGTPLMFQELLRRIDEMNQCDAICTTNWFGAILPEVEVPLVTIFHSNASMVLDSIKRENLHDSGSLDKWVEIARRYDLAGESSQSDHERVILTNEKYFAQNSDRIVAVSDFLKSSLIKYYSADPAKITTILNTYPVDWDSIPIDKDFLSSDLKIFCLTRLPADFNGFVGKGADRVLEYFSRLEGKKLLIASTKEDSYHGIINDFGHGTTLIENASREDVGKYLANAHISFHPSRSEACQLTLIEAMLMQNAPISYNVGVAKELIKHGVNGFIVSTVDEALEITADLLANREKLESIATNARRTILERLSPQQIGAEYLDFFTQIIDNAN